MDQVSEMQDKASACILNEEVLADINEVREMREKVDDSIALGVGLSLDLDDNLNPNNDLNLVDLLLICEVGQ